MSPHRWSRRLVLPALALTFVGGCTHRVWFTQPMRESYELGVVAHRTTFPPEDHADDQPPATVPPKPERSPAELQYFVSQRVVLEREVTSRDDSLAQGRIRVRRGRFIEQIVVRRGTPGIATAWGDDWIAISFEEGSALRFDLGAVHPDGDKGDVYNLRNTTNDAGHPEVALGDKMYRVVVGSGARLKVRRNDRTQRSKKRKVLRGRRLE